jgi:hypothetical protein
MKTLTHPSGLRLEVTLARKIQREGVNAIPETMLESATPSQAKALLELAGYGSNHPVFTK